jgi:hypothetical protein
MPAALAPPGPRNTVVLLFKERTAVLTAEASWQGAAVRHRDALCAPDIDPADEPYEHVGLAVPPPRTNSRSLRRTIGTREHDRVTIGIAEPDFPVVGTAVAVRGIAVARHEDRGSELRDPRRGRIEVVDLEPQEHAVPVGPVLGIADRAVVVIDLEPVELEDERAIRRDQPLVVGAAVRAPASEETPAPAAARLDVTYGNQGLGTHVVSVGVGTLAG